MFVFLIRISKDFWKLNLHVHRQFRNTLRLTMVVFFVDRVWSFCYFQGVCNNVGFTISKNHYLKLVADLGFDKEVRKG